ncbi:MAG: asparagine synthetase B, partial [Elusimicrobia bacterium]|nr:asparagine synthetase B [Elusimicrobiota bacterium]
RMSMAHSLEVRPSMLDHELVELSNRIPAHFKIRGLSNKWILRRLLKNKIPQEILRLPKRGFTPPLSLWLVNPKFQDFVTSTINSSSLAAAGILRPGLAEELIGRHQSRRGDHTRRLWVLLGLALFYERHKKHLQT